MGGIRAGLEAGGPGPGLGTRGEPRRVAKRTQGGSTRVLSAGFSPDGRQVAMGCDDGFVRVLDLDPVRVRWLGPFTAPVSALAYSPDGRHLAFRGGVQSIRICDAGSGRLSRVVNTGEATAGALVWSADGRSLAVGGDGVVRIYDSRDGQERRRVEVNDLEQPEASFTHEPKECPADGDGDLADRARRTLVSSLVWARSGDWLMAGQAAGGSLLVLPERRSILFPEPVHALALSADDRWLLVAHGGSLSRVALETMETRTLQAGAAASVTALALSADGQALAVAGEMLICLGQPDPRMVAGLKTRPRLSDCRALAWAPDGRELAVGDSEGLLLVGTSRRLRMWGDAWLLEDGPAHCLRGGPVKRFALADGSGDVEPWLPPAPAAEPRLTVSAVSGRPTSGSDGGPPEPTLRISVANTGPATATDLHLELASSQTGPDGAFDSLVALAEGTRLSLEPGRETTLEARVVMNGATPPDRPTRVLSICLEDTFGTLATLPVTVDFSAARPWLDRVTVSGGFTALGQVPRVEMTLFNAGWTATGPLQLTLAAIPCTGPAGDDTSGGFLTEDWQTFPETATRRQLLETLRLSGLGPRQSASMTAFLLNANGIVSQPFDLFVRVVDTATPSHRWVLVARRVPPEPWFQPRWTTAPLVAAFSVLLWFILIGLHPIVRRAGADPAYLPSLPLGQLAQVERILRWSGRFDRRLAFAGLDRERWGLFRSLSAGPRATLAAFARATGSRVERLALRCGPGWSIEVTLPSLGAGIPRQMHLVGVASAGDVPAALSALPAGDGSAAAGQRLLLVLLAEAAGAEAASLPAHPTPLGWPVLFDGPRLRAVVLAAEPVARLLEELAAILSDRAPEECPSGILGPLCQAAGRRRNAGAC